MERRKKFLRSVCIVGLICLGLFIQRTSTGVKAAEKETSYETGESTKYRESGKNSDAITEASSSVAVESMEQRNDEEVESFAAQGIVTSTWGTSPVVFDPTTGALTVSAGTISSATKSRSEFFDNENKIRKTAVKTIVLQNGVVAGSDSSYLFSGDNSSNLSDNRFTNLVSIVGSLDTSNVTDMSNMFDRASKLTTLDVSDWDTSNVTSMRYMFFGANSLTKLDVSDWNTSNVTNMRDIFRYATNLIELDVSSWDTSNVVNMMEMFTDAHSLTNLDVSNWDTSNVTNMQSMFLNAKSLTKLDVSGWNTSNVRDMGWLFNGASNLTKLDVSKWNTSKVTDMDRMFKETTNLKSITLGPKSIFNDKVELPAVNTTSGKYTGGWERKVPSSPAFSYKNSTELMTKYNGSMPGTYEWEEETAWIPTYSKWLDSSTNVIPKSNTFLLREMENTEIVETDGLSPDPDNPLRYIYDSDEANVPRSIKFKNVGYYDGESISAKVTLTPDFNPKRSKYTNIGTAGSTFLQIQSGAPARGKLKVKYEFFDQKDQKIHISGYWNFSNLNIHKSVAIPVNQIDHLYSVDRKYSPPIGIAYAIDEDDLVLSGQNTDSSATAADKQVSLTYNNLSEFSFTIISKTVNVYVTYPTNPLVKVAIPDPQGIEQIITDITEKNETQLNYKFVQQIPYETPENSDQQMTWELISPAATDALIQGEWRVIDESGVDRTNLFIFNVDSLGNGRVKPENIKNAKLYNHYYLFERRLRFSGKEVDENSLTAKENGRYLNYRGGVELKVDSLASVKTNFTTSINFSSKVDYQYLLEGTSKSVPGSESQPSQVTGLITHKYPIQTAPMIEDYHSVSQVPESVGAEKIRYTKEKVTFNYEFIPGDIGITVPEVMAFKETKSPVSKKTKVLREDPDWAIKVTDQRAASIRGQWQLTARLKEPFTNKKEQTLDSVLKFKGVEDKQTYTLDESNSVSVYQSGKIPDKVTNQEIRWPADAGFYLDFDAFGFYPAGEYKSVIEFSLESVPTS